MRHLVGILVGLVGTAVALLVAGAGMGIAYEDLNLWVFVVIHPMITIILAWWVLRLRRQIKGPSKGRRKSPEVLRLDPPAIQIP